MCFTPLFPTPSMKKDVCEFLCHFFLIFLICVSASVFPKMLPNTKHNYFGNIHFIQSPIYTIYILDPRYTINFAPSGWIIRYVHLNLSVHYGLESIHSLKVQLLKIFKNVITSTQFANKYKVAIMARVPPLSPTFLKSLQIWRHSFKWIALQNILSSVGLIMATLYIIR